MPLASSYTPWKRQEGSTCLLSIIRISQWLYKIRNYNLLPPLLSLFETSPLKSNLSDNGRNEDRRRNGFWNWIFEKFLEQLYIYNGSIFKMKKLKPCLSGVRKSRGKKEKIIIICIRRISSF